VADAKAKRLAGFPTPKQSSGKQWNEGLITAETLQSKQFKPVRIILPDLIPEGTTILAGKPKVGKSWLALDVCMAVADETRFVLGDKRPIHGDVLYIALEDNQRRLKKRIDKIAQGQARWSNRLALHTEWKRVDQGGLEDIEAWCKSTAPDLDRHARQDSPNRRPERPCLCRRLPCHRRVTKALRAISGRDCVEPSPPKDGFG